jgi:hypothetical protein
MSCHGNSDCARAGSDAEMCRRFFARYASRNSREETGASRSASVAIIGLGSVYSRRKRPRTLVAASLHGGRWAGGEPRRLRADRSLNLACAVDELRAPYELFVLVEKLERDTAPSFHTFA